MSVGPTRRAAEIAALLMHSPCTIRDILDRSNLGLNQGAKIRAYLDEFHDLGCIYIKDWVFKKFYSGPIEVWAWQPSPFHFPDASIPRR